MADDDRHDQDDLDDDEPTGIRDHTLYGVRVNFTERDMREQIMPHVRPITDAEAALIDNPRAQVRDSSIDPATLRLYKRGARARRMREARRAVKKGPVIPPSTANN